MEHAWVATLRRLLRCNQYLVAKMLFFRTVWRWGAWSACIWVWENHCVKSRGLLFSCWVSSGGTFLTDFKQLKTNFSIKQLIRLNRLISNQLIALLFTSSDLKKIILHVFHQREMCSGISGGSLPWQEMELIPQQVRDFRDFLGWELLHGTWYLNLFSVGVSC